MSIHFIAHCVQILYRFAHSEYSQRSSLSLLSVHCQINRLVELTHISYNAAIDFIVLLLTSLSMHIMNFQCDCDFFLTEYIYSKLFYAHHQSRQVIPEQPRTGKRPYCC